MTEPAEDQDQSTEDVAIPEVGAQTFVLVDPKELTRKGLAYGAGGLLVIVVLLILGVVASGLRTWDEMEGVTTAVLPSVLSIVGTVLGFYFGERNGRRH